MIEIFFFFFTLALNANSLTQLLGYGEFYTQNPTGIKGGNVQSILRTWLMWTRNNTIWDRCQGEQTSRRAALPNNVRIICFRLHVAIHCYWSHQPICAIHCRRMRGSRAITRIMVRETPRIALLGAHTVPSRLGGPHHWWFILKLLETQRSWISTATVVHESWN